MVGAFGEPSPTCWPVVAVAVGWAQAAAASAVDGALAIVGNEGCGRSGALVQAMSTAQRATGHSRCRDLIAGHPWHL